MCSPPLQDQIHVINEPLPSLTLSTTPRKTLLIFLITGNPGLIEYYNSFLTILYTSLRAKYPDCNLHIRGTSLAGFEVGTTHYNGGPFNLEQQIEWIDHRLTDAISADSALTKKAVVNADAGTGTDAATRVVLVGHSVGAYILLEVLRRQKKRSAAGYGHGVRTMKIVGGICLFPTVTHIAKSQSGRRLSALQNLVPFLPFIVGSLSTVLFSFLPTSLVQRLVSLVTGMPAPAAAVTAAFLQSRGGVRQALYLAGYEMREITEDRWGDEVWGVASASATTDSETTHVSNGDESDAQKAYRTKLFFLFGTNDHWVDNETRDELIAARAAIEDKVGDEDKAVFEVDETGVPHGFCIAHNEAVAKKVVGYVAEIVKKYW